MKGKILSIAIIFVLVVSFHSNYAFANNGACGEGSIEDNSTGQCIPICGEGLKYDGEKCVGDNPWIGSSELDWIVIGVLTGIGVAIFGIIVTLLQRRDERRKENLDLIQNYGNQLSEITKEEQNLSTKLDCSLYAERYLDVLDQIAFLGLKKKRDWYWRIVFKKYEQMLRVDVLDYFDQNFRYGLNLWFWYKSNVEKYPYYELKDPKDLGINELMKSVEIMKSDELMKPDKIMKSVELMKPDELMKSVELMESDELIMYENIKASRIFDHKFNRWLNFRFWCRYRKFAPFELSELNEIINLRLKNVKKHLESTKNFVEKKDLEDRQKILKKLLHLSQHTKDGLTESNIRKMFDSEFKTLDPLETIQKYSIGSQNKILPDLMEMNYEEIPDENGLSKRDVLDLIEKYSERLSKLKQNEKNLSSKLDCSIYAEQYLDILDEIASMYRQKLFPKNAIAPFENNFAYGVNLMNWYLENVIKNPWRFNPSDDKLTQEQIENEEKIEDRWKDLRWICRGGDDRKNPITGFDHLVEEESSEKDSEGKITLPLTMYKYDELPEEEGIKPEQTLELMREYSNSLIEITNKEAQLKTQVDCSVYAEQYLDILEQIAYLINSRALVTDSSTFFENNFSYGLTLKIWYDLKVIGAKGQEGRWNEFLKYCTNFENDDYYPVVLKAFDVGEVLPTSMLLMDELPLDLTYKNSNNEWDPKIKVNLPPIYSRWQKFYDNWYKIEKTRIDLEWKKVETEKKKVEEASKKVESERKTIAESLKKIEENWKKVGRKSIEDAILEFLQEGQESGEDPKNSN